MGTIFDDQRGLRWSAAALLTAALLASCAEPGLTTSDPAGTGAGGTSGAGASSGDGIFDPGGPSVSCDPSLSVKSDGPALLVNDPAVLSKFTLNRVLTQLLSLAGATTLTPEELLQQLFDTENTTAAGLFPNNIHCDSVDNGAFKNIASTACPRAEAALAKSAGLFVPGDPDYFAPVALVNRFDLTPETLETCGEYRIVFAKWSGRSDPSNRVFLIFEGALPNPHSGNVLGCHPVAKAWAALEKETDPEKIAAGLEALYFDGLPDFTPIVHPDNFGKHSSEDQPYGRTQGQVRLSQRMEEPWEMREFHLLSTPAGAEGMPLFFAPVTVKNSPAPELFEPDNQSPTAIAFRDSFLKFEVSNLAATKLDQIRMQSSNEFNSGESALAGPAGVDYKARVQSGDSTNFMSSIEQFIANTQLACPPDDPLTAEDILNRATVQTCAGCHAPENFLGAESKLGCGLTWPSGLGGAHIDENGALSPALKDVFLPQRASVMTTFLQACDMNAIWSNLQPVSIPGGLK